MVMYGGLAETGIFNNILGGKVTVARTEVYDALLGGIHGALVAVIIGAGLVLAALILPRSLR